jgi:hypothetical protein
MIQFFPSFNLGDAGVVAMLAVMWWRLGSVEKSIKEAATREEVDAHVTGLRREINGVGRAIDGH